jgi:hypothetical protein
MDVVGHQAIRMHGAAGTRRELSQEVQISQVVAVLKEAIVAVMATLDDVDTQIRNYQPCCPRHIGQNDTNASAVDGEPEN